MKETIRVLLLMNELDYFKYRKCIIFERFRTDTTCCEYDTKFCLKDSVISKLNIPIIYYEDISHKYNKRRYCRHKSKKSQIYHLN